MTNIIQESKIDLFNVTFPKRVDDICDLNFIPESIIAKQLRNQLKSLKTDNNSNTNVDTINTNKINLHVMNIIEAFQKLYCKYIDSNKAMFMINISSQNRDNLTILFGNRFGKLTSQGLSFIMDETVKYVDEYHDMDELLKDTIKKIIFAFEPSVFEISQLMNDSFMRFRIDQKEAYHQLSRVIFQDSKQSQEK